MKRILSILLSLVLLAGLCVPAAAANSYSMRILANGSEKAKGKVGDVITVTLKIESPDGEDFDLYSMQDYVCFDTEYLRFVEGSIKTCTDDNGSAIVQATAIKFSADPIDYPNRVFINRANLNGVSIKSGTVLASFDLEVIKEGESSITHDKIQLFEKAGEFEAVTQKNASIAKPAGSGGEGGGSSGGGGGGIAAPSYTIKVSGSDNGSVSVAEDEAAPGDTVTVTVKPDAGYTLQDLIVKDKWGERVAVSEEKGRYTFVMPNSAVTIEAVFAKTVEWKMPFIDVPSGTYYYDAVVWAVQQEITNGTSETTFEPSAGCTRAQMVTFLWRFNGCPEPSVKNSVFDDVDLNSYYGKAVLWAIEKGITNGTSETTFSPNMVCSRAHMAAFLCRMSEGEAVGNSNPFVDVPANEYYTEPVQWAVENGVTVGTSPTTYSPADPCTRGQMVVFLYRLLAV